MVRNCTFPAKLCSIGNARQIWQCQSDIFLVPLTYKQLQNHFTSGIQKFHSLWTDVVSAGHFRSQLSVQVISGSNFAGNKHGWWASRRASSEYLLRLCELPLLPSYCIAGEISHENWPCTLQSLFYACTSPFLFCFVLASTIMYMDFPFSWLTMYCCFMLQLLVVFSFVAISVTSFQFDVQ